MLRRWPYFRRLLAGIGLLAFPAVAPQLALAQEVAPEKEAAPGGAVWYVAPDGNDLSAGTIDESSPSILVGSSIPLESGLLDTLNEDRLEQRLDVHRAGAA